MKKYRLKKDTFLAKKGGLFREVNESGVIYLQRIKRDASDLFTKIAKDPIIDFDEWFEEVKEFEEWKPTDGKMYRFLNVYGEVETLVYLEDSQRDQFRLSIGNCYPANISYDPIIKEQKLIPQAMHRLRMAAKKAWFEFNGSEGPDWNDSRQKKFSIKRWHVTGAYLANYASNEQYLGGVYFPTSDSAHYYINNNEDDIELLFGVE